MIIAPGDGSIPPDLLIAVDATQRHIDESTQRCVVRMISGISRLMYI